MLREDEYLLKIDVNERTITHKLAEYIQMEFPEYDVDCEYNRFNDIVKKLRDRSKRFLNISKMAPMELEKLIWEDNDALTIYPDIIIHKRGSQEDNLLVIEVKKSSNRRNRNLDRYKIKELKNGPYKYKYGLFLVIDNRTPIYEWI
ncbi:MAG: hypothetical protein ACTSQP_21505 [Promethearchaeota archaeon]